MGRVWEGCGKGVGMVWEWCGKGVERLWELCGKGVGRVWEGCGWVELVWRRRWLGLVEVRSIPLSIGRWDWVGGGRWVGLGEVYGTLGGERSNPVLKGSKYDFHRIE